MGRAERAYKKPVLWLDVDTGHDDAFSVAHCLAARSAGTASVLGLSSTLGNAPEHHTHANTRAVVNACGSDAPVVRGAQAPLALGRQRDPPSSIHGPAGLRGVPTLERMRSMPEQDTEPAAVAMRNAAERVHRDSNGEDKLTLVCCAGLTNVALMLSLYPGIEEKVKVVWMGGSSCGGNITASAEWNAYVDPIAVHNVLHTSQLELVIAPLEITSWTAAPRGIYEELKHCFDHHSKQSLLIGQGLAECLATIGETDAAVHDLAASAIALHPELFHLKDSLVDIETSPNAITEGQTVFDCRDEWRHEHEKKTNCRVAVHFSAAYLWPYFIQTLKHLG